MKFNSNARIVATVCVVLLAIAFNWVYEYKECFTEASKGPDFYELELSGGLSASERFLGGFPFRYYAALQYSPVTCFHAFSLLNLGANILCWSVLLGLVLLYLSKTPDLAKQVNLRDVFGLTLIAALLLAYVQTIRQRCEAHASLAARIAAQGDEATLSTYLPAFFADSVPALFKQGYARVSAVRLTNPSSELVSEVLQLPNLVSLKIGGGTYDIRLLDTLGDNIFFQALQIAGRAVDAELIVQLARAKQLEHLNLMRTNVDARGMELLGAMPMLRCVNLSHTNVELSESAVIPQWATAVERLVLPRPKPGNVSACRLEGWPKLQTLAIADFDNYANSTPMALEVRQMPQLQAIQVDVLQLVDMDLYDLPLLEQVHPLTENALFRASPTARIPSFPWVRNLRFYKLPGLQQASIQVYDLNDVDIQDCPQMSLGLSSDSYDQNSGNRPKTAFKQEWLQAVADLPIRELDISHCSLEGLDLSALSKNATLSALMIGASGITDQQVLQLRGMASLRSLDTTQLELTTHTLQELIAGLPNLQELNCERDSISRLKLEDLPNLRKIFNKSATRSSLEADPSLDLHPTIDALHLRNLPNLNEEFVFSPSLQYLHLENVPSINALLFHAPLPAGSQLNGLQDLEVFVGGGSNLSTEIIHEILACPNLKSLTLAHVNCEAEVLSRIGTLKKLTSLRLVGTRINNEAIADWSFDNLRVLRLDDTPVGNTAFRALLGRMINGQRFDAMEIGLSNADAESIKRITELSPEHLYLPGAEMTPATARLLAADNRVVLDLSKTKLDRSTIDELLNMSRYGLQRVVLNGATVDPLGLRLLTSHFPNTLFDVTDIESDLLVVDQLVQSGRAMVDDGDSFYWLMDFAILGKYKSNWLRMNVDTDWFSPAREAALAQWTQGMAAVPAVGANRQFATPSTTIYVPYSPWEAVGYYLGRLLKPISEFVGSDGYGGDGSY